MYAGVARRRRRHPAKFARVVIGSASVGAAIGLISPIAKAATASDDSRQDRLIAEQGAAVARLMAIPAPVTPAVPIPTSPDGGDGGPTADPVTTSDPAVTASAPAAAPEAPTAPQPNPVATTVRTKRGESTVASTVAPSTSGGAPETLVAPTATVAMTPEPAPIPPEPADATATTTVAATSAPAPSWSMPPPPPTTISHGS